MMHLHKDQTKNLLSFNAKMSGVKLMDNLSINIFVDTNDKVVKNAIKGHSQLWDRADLDTSFLTLKRVHVNLK